MVATIGTNTVVPLRVGASFLKVTFANGWFVEVAQTQRHNFSLNVAKNAAWFATGAAAKPTGDKTKVLF